MVAKPGRQSRRNPEGRSLIPKRLHKAHDVPAQKRVVDRHEAMNQASSLRRFGESGEVLAGPGACRLLTIEHHQLADGDVQKSGDLDKCRSGNSVGSVLVFLDLLERDPEMFAKRGL